MIDVLPVYIGYDPREADAYAVCERSLRRHSNMALYVRKLHLNGLRQAGLYWREHEVNGHQRIDKIDGLPFSTDFSFSRFMVPELQNFDGWACFVDCDFLFLDDIAEVAALADPSKAVMVCKQTHVPTAEIKMDDIAQTRYTRKNWSSFMLFNCGHPANRDLTAKAVNSQTGRWLNGFGWLTSDLIGEIPSQWNWIEGVTDGEPKAVHYSEGGPWFKGYEDCAYAQEWTREWRLWRHDLHANGPYNMATPRELVA